MKKIVFTLILSIFMLDSFSQNSVALNIGLSNTYSLDANRRHLYTGLDIHSGVKIETKSGSLGLSGIYSFSGYNGSRMGFALQSHQLGGIVEYRFLSNNKIVSPILKIRALSEVGTNYRDNYLYIEDKSPVKIPLRYPSIYAPSGEMNVSYFYHSTPFYGNILIGCDMQIISGLNLNLSIGYGLRSMKTRLGYWDSEKVLTNEELYQIQLNTEWIHLLDSSIGINYSIPIKKKIK